MSATSIYNNSAGQGGLASARALSENAGLIQSFVMSAQKREYRNEAVLGMNAAPTLGQ